MMEDKVVGRNSVLELLRSGKREIERLFVMQGGQHPRLRQISTIAQRKGIRCEPLTRRELDEIEGTVPHQGVIAIVSPLSYTDLQTIVNTLQNVDRPAILIMLDGVQDPRNLGAIIRTADAVDAHGIIIPKHKAAGVTIAANKASAGSAEYVPIAQVTNLARTIEQLKKEDIWVVGSDQGASTPYTQADLTAPTCLVLGNEATGLRRLVKEKCDLLVHLPMFGHVPSLNVSVAAGVLLYEVMRQRSELAP